MAIRWKSSKLLRFIAVIIMVISIIKLDAVITNMWIINHNTKDIKEKSFYATDRFSSIFNSINDKLIENFVLSNEPKEFKYDVPNIKYILIYDDKYNNIKIKSNVDEERIDDTTIAKLKEKSEFYFIINMKKKGTIYERIDTSLSKEELINLGTNKFDLYEQVKDKNLKMAYFVLPNSFQKDVFSTIKQEFENARRTFYNLSKQLTVDIILLILSMIYIIIYSKNHNLNKSNVEKIYHKSWIEIKVLLIYILGKINLLSYIMLYQRGRYKFIEFIILIIVGTLDYYILTFTYNSIRKEGIKNIIKNKSLLYKSIPLIKKLLTKRDIGFKIMPFIVATVIFIVLIIMLVAGSYNSSSIFAFTILYFSCYVIFMCFRITEFEYYLNKILIATSKISNGDMNCVVEEKGRGLLRDLAYNINHIKTGFKESLIKEMKSERMKSELITNVSHDLKTPLTSIINYVDLLKNEDLSEEERRDYINILDRKSQRLKILIEDLFEASKAASGELQLNIEKVDIVALLKQALTEFDERIKESGLDFKVNLPKEKIYVMVDGKKTWRIFENQITNILKYSLKNTRVYINLKDEEDKVSISMKNISQYELDFSEEEIIERFRRGDKSRNTEGSGLGLAISKSLAELQGGNFNINIDGDLFKVIIEFPKYK